MEMLSDYLETLISELKGDLDFHGEDTSSASHDLHSFPAKFPPQLPRTFISALTSVGDVVLDPMAGSGTTLVEAYLTGRHGVGFDIDPLALAICRAKTTPLDKAHLIHLGTAVLDRAREALRARQGDLHKQLEAYSPDSKKFIEYWFAKQTQLELQALLNEIRNITSPEYRAFLELVFSGVIITKSGGVSLAFDLAHTRPHRAKIAKTKEGEIILGHELVGSNSSRIQLLTKTVRSAIDDFQKRLQRSLSSLVEDDPSHIRPNIQEGDAKQLPLMNNTVDLIVTSPPYAANAIDYMRAHKFSLVWMGYTINELGKIRRQYIGGESTTGLDLRGLPKLTSGVIANIASRNQGRSRAIHRYYLEMQLSLLEMFRVLKPGKAAIVVVGTSIIEGVDIRIGECLAEIGTQVGFQVPRIGTRDLDRNKRMLPASANSNERNNQIEQRMHDEYVIGFYKPNS